MHDPEKVQECRNQWIDEFARNLRDDIVAWQEGHDSDAMPTQSQDKEIYKKHYNYYNKHASRLAKRAENSFGPEGAVANSFGELWRSDAERNLMFQIPGYHDFARIQGADARNLFKVDETRFRDALLNQIVMAAEGNSKVRSGTAYCGLNLIVLTVKLT